MTTMTMVDDNMIFIHDGDADGEDTDDAGDDRVGDDERQYFHDFY